MTQDSATPGAATPGDTPAADPDTAAVLTPDEAPAPGALDGLDGLDDLPVGEHVERFTHVHDVLRARLDGREEQGATGPDAGPAR